MIFLLKFCKDFLTLQGHSKAFESKVACASTISLLGSLVQRIPGDRVGKLSILSCLEVHLKTCTWLGGWQLFLEQIFPFDSLYFVLQSQEIPAHNKCEQMKMWICMPSSALTWVFRNFGLCNIFLRSLIQLVFSVLQAIYGKIIPKIVEKLSSQQAAVFLGASRKC